MSISSGKIVHKREIVVDPNFGVPPGTQDIRYLNDDDIPLEDDDQEDLSDDEPIVGEIVIVDDDDDSDDGGDLPIPDEMEIVEQVFRTAEDGTSSVDVTIWVPDYIGVSQIDVRLTKV